MVVEPAAGAVLAVAAEKVKAIASAREVLRAAEMLEQQRAYEAGQLGSQGEMFPIDPPAEAVAPEPRHIPKRRREVFTKSAGRCHYCSTALQLGGVWHVEHMLPRALGGDDAAGNLVAACAPCNLAKRDRTAIEFFVEPMVGTQ
jgi:hypothetical protein